MSSRPQPSKPFAVYLALAVGILGFAISPILVRMADAAPGLTLAVWRTVFAVLLLAPFAIPGIGAEVRAFTKRESVLVVVAGVVLGLHFITWIESLYHTSVASASTLVAMSPIFLALLGAWLLHERLRRGTIIAIVTAVGGSVLIGIGDASDAHFPRAVFGNALALTAALLVTVYLLIGRVIRRKTSWMAYVFPLYLIVAVTCVVAALLRGTPLFGFGWEIYGLCLAMAVFPQIIGHGSFNYALKFFPAAILGLLSLSEPVAASVIAYFLFGEIPHLVAITGMIVVLISIGVAIVSPVINHLRRRKALPQ